MTISVQDLVTYENRLTDLPTAEVLGSLTELMSDPLFSSSYSRSPQQEANCLQFVLSLGLPGWHIQELIAHMLVIEPTVSRSNSGQKPPLLLQYFIAYAVFLNNCKMPPKEWLIGERFTESVIEKAHLIKARYLKPDYQSAYKTCKGELQKSTLTPDLNTKITELLQQAALAAKNENNQTMLAKALNATTRLLRHDISTVVYASIMNDIKEKFAYNPVYAQEAEPTSVGRCCKIITDIMEAIVEAFVSAASAMTRRDAFPTFFAEESKAAGEVIEDITSYITPKK